MSKLKKEHLNQMIENALTYKQDKKIRESNAFHKRFQGLMIKPNFYGLTFTSLIISCVFIPQILMSRNIVDVNEINDFVTLEIIDDL